MVKRAQDSEAEEIRRLASQTSTDAAAARAASLAPTQASLARPPATLPGAAAVPFSGPTFTPPSMASLGASPATSGGSTGAVGVTPPRAEAVRAPVAGSSPANPGVGPREADGGFAPTGPSQNDNYDRGRYMGTTFAGTGIDTARQLPGGDKIPKTNDIARVVTDPSGRVVGWARQASSPEAAQAISRANPNGGIDPVSWTKPEDLSPMDRRDYDRAVAAAKERTAAEAEERRLRPVWVPDGKGGTSFVNPNIARERARQREDAERAAISRSIGISEWNSGKNPSLNAISEAEVALSPGGWSTVGTNRDFRRQQVERGMGAELPGFLPPEMADRMRARQQAFGDKLQTREAEQNYFEGLSQTPAFDRAFGPMSPRQDPRLSDRELARRIQMDQRS